MKSSNSFQIVETGSKRLYTRKILLIASICLFFAQSVLAAIGTVYYNDALQELEGLEYGKLT